MKRVTLVFPGQGSQYIGMGHDLYKKYDVARKTFEEANDVLGFDLKKMCFEGDMNELTETKNTQPALLTTSVAAFRVYMKEYGMPPEFMMGHSIGEFSALTCSEVIKFADALKIVRQRGIFMQEAVVPGVGEMTAISGININLIKEECEKICNDIEKVGIACYNSPNQIVISGNTLAVKKVGEKFIRMGANVTPLKVSAPFHSMLMQTASDKFEEELMKYTYSESLWPVVSNLTAEPYMNKAQVIKNLTLQMIHPVRWYESMNYIQDKGAEIVLELGPKTVLKNLVKNNFKGIKAYSFDENEDRKALGNEIGTIEKISKELKMKILSKCMASAVCICNRNWNNEEYCRGVVEPYNKIKKLYEELEASGKEPTIDNIKEALHMLKSVFTTKKAPLEEKKERINRLVKETGDKHLFEYWMDIEHDEKSAIDMVV
ncbi:ACP S-malonyltransferase [Clostridium estertheticum]|uniref:[acyl-carrier-protein] S-malonyltransferase n=1 Tax=Clostridium estertheticum TaxID=238834 RepID=A0A5N7J834_9CLOT|nr:ACP S-malonyltransferase [Clostridium estertheticum]MPQ34080.1 ACP S-malonyltransferase [Clostridium estertheticum]MPQ64881.1 ACP S-malonyltransferase [Clostridium estertheticum]